jgi:hypothetical protein
VVLVQSESQSHFAGKEYVIVPPALGLESMGRSARLLNAQPRLPRPGDGGQRRICPNRRARARWGSFPSFHDLWPGRRRRQTQCEFFVGDQGTRPATSIRWQTRCCPAACRGRALRRAGAKRVARHRQDDEYGRRFLSMVKLLAAHLNVCNLKWKLPAFFKPNHPPTRSSR